MLWLGGFGDYLMLYRVAWIGGRLGGGKTCLAYALARYVARREGFGIISNIEAVGAARTFDRDQPVDRHVVVLDEAADFLDSYSGSSMNLLPAFKYARHFELCYLFPSIDPIQKRLRKLVVMAYSDMPTALLLGFRRVFLYRWWVGPDVDPPSKKDHVPHGWIVYVPGRSDWAYNGVHRGRGLTTLLIIKRLLQEMREAENE